MSVRKRNWTSPSGEAREAWVVNYTDGNRTRRLKTFKKKKDADGFAATTSVEVRSGTHIADSASPTVREAGKLWLAAGEEAGLERTTLDQRRQHLDLHLNPFLGDTKLTKLTAPSIRDFQRDLRAAGRTEAMVKRVTTSLGSILAEMLEDGKAMRNPVHELSRSRRSKAAKVEARKEPLRVGVDIPTNDEIRLIINAASGRFRPLLVTAIFTGMRASELRGLTWDAVDLNKGQVTVRQRADRYNEIGSPKSKAGFRVIPLPPLVVNTLKGWRKDCPKSELGLVFPNGAGNVEAHPNIVTRGLWPALLKAGVSVRVKGKMDEDGNPLLAAKYPGLHALRHWFASWCINRKADGGLELTAKAVQERMGHSSITVTMDVYGHLFPAVDEAEALAEAERALMVANS
ncbi:MAG TPA: tyrosine-type recombinase/integrase [Devosia sp.]|nr:tyrosine-type recombinase/integrase [Devosia sp.]